MSEIFSVHGRLTSRVNFTRVMIFRWPSCPIFQHADIFSIYRIALLYITPLPSARFLSTLHSRISLNRQFHKSLLIPPPSTVTLIFLPIILRTHFLSRYQINNYFNKAVKFTETHVCTHEECNFRFEWNPRVANVITAALKWRIIKVKSNNRVKSVLDF